MSSSASTSVIPQLRPPVAAPTFLCVTCQMSLRNEDERLAHMSQFPLHRVKSVTRVSCPSCGNRVPLENGRYPAHWVGYGSDLRKCRSSGQRA